MGQAIKCVCLVFTAVYTRWVEEGRGMLPSSSLPTRDDIQLYFPLECKHSNTRNKISLNLLHTHLQARLFWSNPHDPSQCLRDGANVRAGRPKARLRSSSHPALLVATGRFFNSSHAPTDSHTLTNTHTYTLGTLLTSEQGFLSESTQSSRDGKVFCFLINNLETGGAPWGTPAVVQCWGNAGIALYSQPGLVSNLPLSILLFKLPYLLWGVQLCRLVGRSFLGRRTITGIRTSLLPGSLI